MTSTRPTSILRNLYKSLLSTANKVPDLKQRVQIIQEIRQDFRDGLSDANNPSEVQKFIKKAQSRLGYLKIITPKHGSSGGAGKSKYVMRDGELVEGSSHTFRGGAVKTGIDPEDLARHHRLVRRQHFMDRN